MKILKGDLIDLASKGEFDVIIHGCNCFCTMGAGIAVSIRDAFPSAYEADCTTARGARSKLGTYTYTCTVVPITRKSDDSSDDDNNGATTTLSNTSTLTIVNAYTQYHWKRKPGQPENTRLADYDAIRSVFHKVKQQFTGKRIGYPRIGAGLAHGNWDIISRIIDEELEEEDHTYVEFEP